MSAWPSTRSRRVLAALLRIGWVVKRHSGSHRTLSRTGWADFVFAFHEDDEIGPRMLARIAKRTGLRAEDLCKAQWDAGDVAKHFRRFCEVELKCCGPWETEDQTHQKRAAYFAFMLEGPARPDVTALEDANRVVGVYALAIELFLSHVLQDCMEKGQSEVGTFGESYQIVRRYFGWSDGELAN